MKKNKKNKSPNLFPIRISESSEWLFIAIIVILDAYLLNCTFKFIFNVWLYNTPNSEIYLNAFYNVRHILFIIYLIFSFLFFNLYKLRTFGVASDVLINALSSLFTTFIAFNVLVFYSRSLSILAYTFPRPVVLFSTMVATFVIFCFRIILFRLFRPYPVLHRTVIVGNETEGKKILRIFHKKGGIRFKLIKTYTIEELESVASDVIFHQIHEVIITDPSVSLDKFWAKIYWERKEPPHQFFVRIIYDPSKTIGYIDLSSLDSLPLITISSIPLSKRQQIIKRTFDIIFSLLALIVTSPIMLLTAILIKLDSEGPIFYKQRRVGQYGKEFDVIKFRTMKIGAESQSGPKIATADDPRVTRIGKYLRKLGIDELPQFFLVLVGDMAVVGPRPERPYFVKQYIEFQGRRLSVLPGVTGLAAVNARYYLRLTDKVSYDYYYIDNYSLLLDIKIIIQTIWVVLFEPEKTLNYSSETQSFIISKSDEDRNIANTENSKNRDKINNNQNKF